MNALICWAVNFLLSILTFQSVPIWRLTDRMVRSTLVTACRLATSPTSTSPFLAKATTDGVVRAPSAFAMTVGSPPSRTATTEFVVPRSIPTARAMVVYTFRRLLSLFGSSFTGERAAHQMPGQELSPARSSHTQGVTPQQAISSRAGDQSLAGDCGDQVDQSLASELRGHVSGPLPAPW